MHALSKSAATILIFGVTVAMVFVMEYLHRGFSASVVARDFGSIGPVGTLAQYSVIGFASFVAGVIPFAVIEVLSRQGEARIARLRSYAFPLLIWACFYILSCSVVALTALFKKATSFGITELPFEVPFVVHVILFILLIDFFGYWFHRLEHTSRFLWQFHATHHSLTHLNAVNQYGHWFEGLFRFFAVYVPVSLLLPTPDLSASSIAVIWGVWTRYVHTDVPQLALPAPLRHVFVDNVFHHHHHGVERRFHDSNYGFLLTIWDRLFGTLNMPKDNAFPETGLSYLPPPASPRDYLFHPFKERFDWRAWKRKPWQRP